MDIPVIHPRIAIKYMIISNKNKLEILSNNINFRKNLIKFKYFIDKGCIIYLAIHNNNDIVGYYIISRLCEYKPYLYLNNPLFEGDNKYYIFFCHTFYEFENNGIYSYILTQICNDVIRDTDTEVFISSDAENIASQKGIEKAGFKRVGILNHCEIKNIIFISELIKSGNTP